MSKKISCQECGYENPYGSKFCNNCGTKLPLSTHIICPNCETSNSLDRVFCDNCGTRLIAEEPQKKPDDAQESQPSPSTPFSLPARQPGDTGELNPNAVPDWLRTGDIGRANMPDSEADDQPKPAEKKGTKDLPDWLVHDSDPEPIIDAPTTISTEFYQDLLDEAEDLPQPDDLYADEEANLPDWLSEADLPESHSQDDPVSSGLTNWLGDLDDSAIDEEPATPIDDADEAASTGLTDWLLELDEMANLPEAQAAEDTASPDDLLDEQPIEEEDSSDWLVELGPAETDIFEADSEEAEPAPPDDLPGWIEELGPLETNLLAPDEIAELTGLDGDTTEDADLVEDEEAGADVSFTGLFETANEEIKTLPGWLDTATEDGESFLSEPPHDLELDEPGADSDLDGDWFGSSQDDEEAESDWLSDMVTVQPEEIVVESEPEETAVPADLAADFEELDEIEELVEPEPEPESAVPAAEDSWSKETIIDEGAVEEGLPEWLSQLDKTDKKADPDDMDMASEELPEWIASMRPSEGLFGSELPSVFSEADIRDALEGIPEELAGAELPDWLQDTPLDEPPLTPSADPDRERESMPEIPDWLRPDDEAEVEKTEPAPTASIPDVPESVSSRSEWNVLLDELPPLTPLAESLPKADIPEWVQQLKPPELTGKPPLEPEGPEETAGPLKGMQGIVSIEPAIAKPRAASPVNPLVTSPEQQQQVALLRQISLETPQAVTTLATKTKYETTTWLRLLVAALLIAALLFGLLGPTIASTEASIPASVQAVEASVSAAAGLPVLVAFEYTPALAAELSPQAELMLTQLAANDSIVLVVSQYAAGTAVAGSLVENLDAQTIGYLPGESVGLRQLGDCLAGRNRCSSLNGRVLDDDLQTDISQIGLIIVLTGDRESLVNWVEQVGTVANDVPLVAGVTQSLTPLARSYAATGQIRGLLGGMPETAAYAQLGDQSTGGLQVQMNAQITGQLLAGVLLLVGLLTYGTAGAVKSRRRKN